MTYVNAILQGIFLGGLYALFACGLSLMFGVMKVVNLAHGDLAVVEGYVAIGIITVTHVPVLWSVLIVVPVMAPDRLTLPNPAIWTTPMPPPAIVSEIVSVSP